MSRTAARALHGLADRLRSPFVLLGLARAAASALGLASAALVAALLGPSALGVWALALNLQGWVQHLGEMGLRSAATAEAAGTGKPTALIRPYLLARLGCTLIAAGAAWLGALWAAPELAPVLGIVLLALVPMALQLDWVALVDGRPLAAALPLVVRPLAFLAGLALWPGALEPWSVGVVFVVSWFAAAAVTWPGLPRDRTAPPGTALRLLRSGPPLALNSLLNQALLGLDLWVVAHLAGTAAAGSYHLAAQLATAGLVTANAAGQLALARPAATPAVSGRALVALAWLGAGQGAMLAAIGPWLVPALFGQGFAATAPLLGAFAAWITVQHLSASLQAERTVAGARTPLVAAAVAALAVTALMLLAAAVLGRIDVAALSRPAAEAVRIAILLASAAPALRKAARAALLPLVLLAGLLVLAPFG